MRKGDRPGWCHSRGCGYSLQTVYLTGFERDSLLYFIITLSWGPTDNVKNIWWFYFLEQVCWFKMFASVWPA